MKKLQIVGYQNSGKTTFAQEMTRALKARNVKVGVIKHHGHTADLTPHKDSSTHFTNGADLVITNSEKQTEIFSRFPFDLESSLQYMEASGIEVALIEGYKREDYPKVVLLSKKEDEILLEKLENIIGIYETHGYKYEEKQYPLIKWGELINRLIKAEALG